MSATYLDGKVTLHGGDCREVIRTIPDASVDSVVSDPPYALVSIVKRFGGPDAAPAAGGVYNRSARGFMGKTWDTGEAAFAVEFWSEVMRVLKPGGHVVAFSGTRTYHRLACAIEDAGFEIRDQLAWMYGSGFPKSHDVSKGIDKLDAVAVRRDRALRFAGWIRSTGITGAQIDDLTGTNMGGHYTTAASQPAVGTRDHLEALRHLLGDVPAWVEELVDERTVESENFKAREVVGKHDDVAHAAKWRVDYAGGSVAPAGDITTAHSPAAREWQGWGTALKPAWEPIVLARKPLIGTVAANVLEHRTGAVNVDGCRVGTEEMQATASNGILVSGNQAMAGGNYGRVAAGPKAGRWPANILHDGSDEVVDTFPSEDAGESAARFFYSAKADAEDRLGSKHPTVKPVDLMQWLVRLITPRGGLVLDPFAGTGTTGEAAWREGMRCILIEREAEYQVDIARRLSLADAGPDARLYGRLKAAGKVEQDAGPLFGGANDNDAPPSGERAGRSTGSSRTKGGGADHRAGRAEAVREQKGNGTT